jgi:FkbM family methyltransferase
MASFLQNASSLAARFGLHVSRMSQHPKAKMLGLANRPLGLILDVGANQGQFARDMRGRFGAAQIVSFEPLPGPFALLEDWARRDGNAAAINAALGRENGVMPMQLHVDHTTSSSLLATSPHEEMLYPQTRNQRVVDVAVRRLDDVLAELGREIPADSILKLDVQGFEEEVLAGAPETLAAVGALLTEVLVDPLYEGQADFYRLCEIARGAGLRYAGNYDQVIADDGRVVYLDALFTR